MPWSTWMCQIYVGWWSREVARYQDRMCVNRRKRQVLSGDWLPLPLVKPLPRLHIQKDNWYHKLIPGYQITSSKPRKSCITGWKKSRDRKGYIHILGASSPLVLDNNIIQERRLFILKTGGCSRTTIPGLLFASRELHYLGLMFLKIAISIFYIRYSLKYLLLYQPSWCVAKILPSLPFYLLVTRL